jgi:ribosomal protein L29
MVAYNCPVMAKAKNIMDMSPQDLIKSITASVGEYVEARLRTQEISIKAEIKSAKTEIKQDIARLEQKLDKTTEDHEERIEHLEFPHKN